MKTHSTNYLNTFIAIADDCPTDKGEVPPQKGDTKTIANIQYEILKKNPYQFTSDDVLFEAFAQRNELTNSELKKAREQFFSKGQPCFRASPLTKRYGWGIHNNADGKIAMYACDSPQYKKFLTDKNIKVVKAMKTTR